MRLLLGLGSNCTSSGYQVKILIVGGLKRSFQGMGTVKSAIFHANDAGTAGLNSAVLMLPKKS